MRRLFIATPLRSRTTRSSKSENSTNMELENLKDDIKREKKFNIDGDWWLPNAAVGKILDLKRVRRVLDAIRIIKSASDSEYERVLREDLPQELEFSSNNKCILLLLIYLDLGAWITTFVRSAIELPTSSKHLSQDKFSKLSDADQARILEKQYHFIEQDMRFPSLIPKDYSDSGMIFPFEELSDEKGPEFGAFGRIQRFSYYSPSEKIFKAFVRKQFRPRDSSQKDYILELRNLTILSAAKHPNILPPIAAYVHRDKHNLIFPLAEDGNLHRALKEEGRWVVIHDQDRWEKANHFSKLTVTNEDFMYEVCGLISAISTMHSLQTDTVTMIGCHRDLKPENVLVRGRQLILADFGLSRLSRTGETSESHQPNVIPEYLAPECFDLQTLHLGRARRSSDIWALGGMLLKILICRELGPDELEKFDDEKVSESNNIMLPCFFEQGVVGKTVHPLVERQMEILKNQDQETSYCRKLASLISEMLTINQESRPTASQASARAQWLAISVWGRSICNALRGAFKRTSNVSLYWELLRLQGWLFAVGCEDLDALHWRFDDASEMPVADFERLIDQLRGLQQLVRLKGTLSSSRHGRLQPLRFQIDQMISGLSAEQAATAYDHVERELLDNGYDDQLARLQSAVVATKDVYANSGFSATQESRMEQMIILKRERLKFTNSQPMNYPRSFIPFSAIIWRKQSQGLCEIEVPNPSGEGKVLGIAEESATRSQTHNISQTEKEKLDHITRLELTSKMLNRASETGENMRVLPCLGSGCYLENAPMSGVASRSGLVYKIPRNDHMEFRCWTSLKHILSRHSKLGLNLGQKFHLASILASSIYNLHKVSWFHRRLSAANVMLFHNEQEDIPRIVVDNFYLVGFTESRAQNDRFDTDGNGQDDEHEYYQHPRYRSRSKSFCPSFDQYSLGILLLEIGCSRTLPDICPTLNVGSGQEVFIPLDVLLKLELAMGQRYRSVVEYCLSTATDKEPNVAGISMAHVLAQFKLTVVDALRRFTKLDL